MTDIEIADAAVKLPITQIAARLGVDPEVIEPYGRLKAKLPLSLINEDRVKTNRLVLVTAITPTPAGEGKTTVSIGLADGLSRIGKKTAVVLREPSLGPVFGIKGGAAGGGQSQVVPMEDINLNFTGDFNAVEKAHNLLSAMVDNAIHFGPKAEVQIDPRTVTWKRVMDMNDRSLRHITLGLGGRICGVPRESGFDITAASEIMAILCLSRDMADLKKRLGDIYIGRTYSGTPVHARDLKAEGAMAALLRDAMMPNLVQTIAHTPAIVHGGPFANIAQGTNTVVATKMGLSLANYVVTEAGFGSDLGAEKFLDIKCQAAGLRPSVIVIVATVRALKMHGGLKKDELGTENLEALARGMHNLEHHVKNMLSYGVRVVVAINKFVTDTQAEHQAIREACKALGVSAVTADVWGKGGAGAEELACTVVDEAESGRSNYHPLYNFADPIEQKIEAIAKNIYGAQAVEYTPQALKDIANAKEIGLADAAVCIAKTQYSFTDDPKQIGPTGNFTLHVRGVELAAGASFVIPLTGEMMRMPGLPLHPAAENISVDDNGKITGLS
ncbi:MAG: formate--tetrahydrofolate ligase [Bacteroidales bacterium]|nr:formate--tetrahydrofolate ligase [Bacteroidales bacterium]MDY4521339.1 formate--tetrahydrofolate ligase [Bacteroidales bacterium]